MFGNVPALSFYFGLRPALSSTWPDLQSFAYQKFEEEMAELDKEEKKPVVIMSANPTDIGKDESAGESLRKKVECLEKFMSENSYKQGFSNDSFVVYIRQ